MMESSYFMVNDVQSEVITYEDEDSHILEHRVMQNVLDNATNNLLPVVNNNSEYGEDNVRHVIPYTIV